MRIAFQIVRAPVTLALAILLLTVGLPLWIALGVFVFCIGAVILPFVFIHAALTDDQAQVKGYVSALFDWASWFEAYGSAWTSLGNWQRGS